MAIIAEASTYDEVYAYGDTKGDKPMLELATFKFYRPFR
jgi:phosphoserine phosphatase